MSPQPTRFPLTWPSGWDRTSADARRPGRFRYHGAAMTVGEAVRRLSAELKRLGVPADEWFVSSNIPPRIDGLPSGNASGRVDPGVAVYFKLFARDQVLACDAWQTAADNLAAIAGHIEALRAIDRYKVGNLEQAFSGYTALPAKGGTWRSTLGFGPDDPITRELINSRFRQLAREAHPDLVGGTDARMKLLTEARASALFEIQS